MKKNEMTEQYKLILGDCLEVMKDISDNSIDLIVTDPPYGVGFSKGFDDSIGYVETNIDNWFREMYRVLKEGSHAYIYVPTIGIELFISTAIKYFTLKNVISGRTYTSTTYLKNNFQYNNQIILFLHKGKGRNFNNYDFIKTSQSWLKDKRNKNPKPYTYSYPAFLPDLAFANTKGNGRTDRHPAEKNIELIKFFIGISSDEGDVVLDMFMGGGSTGVAAVRNLRRFIGIELNEDYFNIAKKRLENANYKQLKLF